jgi:glycosyltransferase involved in cell wall biosynthesis
MPASVSKLSGDTHNPQWLPSAGALAIPLSILVLSPDPSVHGGVAAFAEMMKANLVHCRVTSLPVGRTPQRRENIFSTVWRLLYTPLKIAGLVRRQHFDIVHINPSLDGKALLRDGLILLALRLARFNRVLVYFHGWCAATEATLKRTAILRWVCVKLLNTAASIMVLAPEFKQSLEDMGVRSKILVTRTMFDGSALNIESDSVPGKRRTILFMSRFVRAKGVYELLEGFARIAGEFPDVDLIMAGDGEENNKLHEQASSLGLNSRVLFPGYVRGATKSRLLHECALFALPTYFPEGLPVALLEAMGAGKPVLTAKAGVIDKVIADPENGIVLSHVTPETVADALRQMLADPAYCSATGKRNAAYAWETFEARTVTQEIEALYNEIARR